MPSITRLKRQLMGAQGCPDIVAIQVPKNPGVLFLVGQPEDTLACLPIQFSWNVNPCTMPRVNKVHASGGGGLASRFVWRLTSVRDLPGFEIILLDWRKNKPVDSFHVRQ